MSNLVQVLEAVEVAMMWCKSMTTVYRACDAGKLRWRYGRTGRRLVDCASVVDAWGLPVVQLDLAVFEVLPCHASSQKRVKA